MPCYRTKSPPTLTIHDKKKRPQSRRILTCFPAIVQFFAKSTCKNSDWTQLRRTTLIYSKIEQFIRFF